ncbi:glycosyltransferase family 4 protein [Halosimplex rubrum]|uniref:Glycosyltransferase family 4 protein n=1 Tax=Halosimplex rubrum TaxID=869889 RepID=A0A7D5P292_9EURY|nr:glycosyltransferase family 4 protein [Halosimplex rubrum]QLH78917.1 glycosyltransferase family 4 protein [Halosimplex rubrum]
MTAAGEASPHDPPGAAPDGEDALDRDPSADPLSVLFVSPMDLSGRSGGNVATKEIAVAFARHHGVELSLVCPRPADALPPGLTDGAERAWFLPEKPAGTMEWHARSQLPTLRAHAAAERAVDPDLIVARVGPSSVFTPLAALVTRTPYVALIRGMVGRNLKFGTVVDALVRANALAADETYVAYGEIADRYGLGEDATVFPNAVDPERFQPMDRAEARERIDAPIDPGDFVVGFVGSLKQRHRVGDLLDAVAALPDGEAVHVLVVGDGPQRDALESRVADAGLTDAVTFCGYVDHDELAPYVGSCDATYGVVDADNPSNPIKCYEYLACERPVITSATDELGFVAERDLGVALDRVSPETVADAIARLRSLDDDALAEMGRRGREYVVENHTWDRLADAVVATYRE